MNHVKTYYKTGEGVDIHYHSWEVRQGGYKWIALVLEGPYLPVDKNKRMVEFLLKKYFKVYSPGIPEITSIVSKETSYNGNGGLRRYLANIGSFRSFIEEREGDMPVIPFVFSISALPFLYYYFNVLPPFKAFVLFSPVLDYKMPPVNGPLFLKRRVKVRYKSSEILSDTEEERRTVEPLITGDNSVSKKLVKDLRREFKKFPGDLPVTPDSVSIGVYYGEADVLTSVSRIEGLQNRLKNGKLEIFKYPRMKHIIFYDKYWKKMEDDLNLFFSGLTF